MTPIIFISISLIILIYTIYISIRVDKVIIFRQKITTLRIKYFERHQYDYDLPPIWDKYSFLDMLFSFKPLKLEAWFTKEEIDKIMG